MQALGSEYLRSCFFHVFVFFYWLKFECKYIEVGNKHLFSYLWHNCTHIAASNCTQIYAHTYSFSLIIYTYFHRNIGRPENRYRIQILVGYGIPLLFIILTGIVEAIGPVCSKWRPRFNEQSCFFSGYYFIFSNISRLHQLINFSKFQKNCS